MRKKQEEFYKIYHKLGRTEEAAEIALGKVYSIKTWSKANRKKQLDKLLSNNDGLLYLDSLEKTKKVRKKLEKTDINLDKSLEKTTFDLIDKQKDIANKKRGGYKYDPAHCNVAREILALGGHDLDVQAAIGISQPTYYRWKIEYPQFHKAILAGKDFFAVENVEASLVRKAKGGHFLKEIITKEDAEGNVIERITREKEQDAETNAAKTIMFNRSPDRYSDKPRSDTEGAQGGSKTYADVIAELRGESAGTKTD